MIDWTKNTSLERLFVVLLATHDHVKFDYYKMADMYGEGATNNSIKGQFAKLKRMIVDLRDHRDPGTTLKGSSPSQKKPREKKSPKQSQDRVGGDKVLKGRVAKTAGKSKSDGIKDENAGSEVGES